MTKIFIIGIICTFGFFAKPARVFAVADETPTADQIVRKAVEQSRESEKDLAASGYTFTKATETEKFDENGRVMERKKSLHEISSKSGCFSKKRVKAPGESADEAKKSEAQDKKEPLKLGKYKASSRGDYLNILTPELIGKYVFTLVNRINLNGRPAFELAFEPKQKNLPAKELAERVLNQATGKIWIDAEEFEVAKAQIRVDSEIQVGGGLLGCLKNALFVIERTRLPGGIWFDRSTRTDYEARKLTESTRVVTKSESRNFQVLPNEG